MMAKTNDQEMRGNTDNRKDPWDSFNMKIPDMKLTINNIFKNFFKTRKILE